MAVKIPKPPAALALAAKARWRAVVPALVRRGAGAVDLETLATYCQVWVRWREAEQGIASSSLLVRNPQGRAVASPLLSIAAQAGTQVRALERQLAIGAADPSAGVDIAEGPLLTRRELAAAFNVHMQTVSKWEQEGAPVAQRGRKGRASRYSEAEVRRWFAARETAASGAGGVVDLVRERARKEHSQALLAEQTLAVRARQLLPAAEVEKVWSGHIAAVRTKLLALPPALSDELHRVALVEGVDGLEMALERAIGDVLRELASPGSSEVSDDRMAMA